MTKKLNATERLNQVKPYPRLGLDSKFTFTCLGSCRENPGCCRDPPVVLPSDVQEMAEYLKIPALSFFDEYCVLYEAEIADGKPGFFVRLRLDGEYCVLLDQKEEIKECRVYDKPPYSCCVFPIKTSGGGEEILLSQCPGVGLGLEYCVKDWLAASSAESKQKEASKYWHNLHDPVMNRLNTLSDLHASGNKKRYRSELIALRQEIKPIIRSLYVGE